MGGKSSTETQDGYGNHGYSNQAIRRVTGSSVKEDQKYQTRFDEFIYGHHDFERRFIITLLQKKCSAILFNIYYH